MGKNISKIEIKTSTLNINKINKANIINKNLYSNLNKLPQISKPNSSVALENNNYEIKFDHNDIQLQQNNRYFNNYNNQNFNNNFNELNNEQEE